MSGPDPDDEHPPWIERVVEIAGALGANRVRVRWKLIRWVDQRRAARRRREQYVEHVKYEHRVCPACRAVNARDEATCTRCGAALHSRPRELLSRLGLGGAAIGSASTFVALVILAAYMRIALAGGNWWTIPIGTLIRHGGNLPAGAADGEPWRYATSMLLHVGMWHLAFNLLALAVVGPRVERAYGRLAMVFGFVVTGVLASIASQRTGLDGVAAGASGALMGLIGIAAVVGHRDGTTIGKHERNAMLRWAAYTIAFGFMIGADNRAHLGGFLAGAAIAFAIPTRAVATRAGRAIAIGLGVVGVAALVGALWLVMVPPA